MFKLNLYDNWMDTVSNYTCFCRLILILKCLSISYSKTIKLVKAKSSSVWRLYSLEQWPDIEYNMRNLILEDFKSRTKIDLK